MNFEKPEKSDFWKNEKEKKNKKQRNAGDTIILHMCTKSHNHMKYSSWDTELGRIFLPFYPFNNPENQNFEEMRKASGGVIILNLCN